MSLLQEQAAFLKDARKLLAFAEEKDFIVTGGELARSTATQAQVVRSGQEGSMDSPHLRKCAITLNFFRDSAGSCELVQNADALEPIGAFWEQLDPRNRWGGRRAGVQELLRFERDPGGWPSSELSQLTQPLLPPTEMLAAATADDARPSGVQLPAAASPSITPVLRRSSANADAISRLQALLVKAMPDALPVPSGVFDMATERAVLEFQRKNGLVSDGVVGEKTWLTLLGETSGAQQTMAQRFIGDADFASAARGLGIELAALKAVYKVESNGKGFIGNEVKILFEGHVFWQRLKRLGQRPEALQQGNEDILYPKQDSSKYVGGLGEHRRLARAEAIDHNAARESASWGLFQIMGYHWQALRYESVDEFVQLMGRHERDQLEAFCRFVTLKKDHSGRTLAELLAARDWTGFAYAYNGSGYRKNAYDDKLREFYRKFSS